MLKRTKWTKSCLFVGTIMSPEGLTILATPQPLADLIEVRYDSLYHAGIQPAQLIPFLKKRKNRVLLTLRTKKEGGVHGWKSTERVHLFKQLIPHVDAIDLEFHNLNVIPGVLQQARDLNKEIILSAHSIKRKLTYGKATRWLETLREYRVQAYKIASLARTQEDLNVLIRILIDYPFLRIGVMALGEQAALSRIILPSIGSKLVYGYLDVAAAKGQPALKEVVAALPWLQE